MGTASFFYHVHELIEEPTQILIKKYKDGSETYIRCNVTRVKTFNKILSCENTAQNRLPYTLPREILNKLNNIIKHC